jgi:MFS family permease
MAEVFIAADLAAPNDPFGTAPTFILSGALCAVGAVAALRLPRHPGGTHEAPIALSTVATRPAGIGSVLRAPHMSKALWASMVVLTATDVLTVYMPAIGAERGWSVAFVSALLAVRAALSFAVRVGTAPLLRLLGRRPLLVGACVIGAVALLLMGPEMPPWVALLLMAITGLALGIGQPLTMAWVSRSAPDGLRATALAARITANRIGQSLIPVAVGGVAALAGSGAIFIVLAALLVSTSVAVARSNLR